MTIDVNAQFDAERAQQIQRAEDRQKWLEGQVAKGEMRKNPNGTYTVLGNGWDRGEVFQANGQPEHGLEILEDGRVAFYGAGVPAWWSLGEVIPSKAKTTTEILHWAGLDFTVHVRPTPFLDENGRYIADVPDSFTTYRRTKVGTEHPIANVGKVYTPIQPVESFGLLDDLSGYMDVQVAGLFKGGMRMFVSCLRPEPLVIDPQGIADQIKMYVLITDSWNGRSNLTAHVTPWRVRCQNTADLAVENAESTFKIRHTKNWKDKAEEARRVLGLTERFAAEFAAEETALHQTAFNADQVDLLINEVWGELDPDASKSTVTKRENLRDNVHKWWEIEVPRIGATAYAAEQTITAVMDHDRNFRTRGKLTPLQALGTAVLEESNAEEKRRAHRKLLEMTTR